MPDDVSIKAQIAARLHEHQAAINAAERELQGVLEKQRAEAAQIKVQMDSLRQSFPERFRKEMGRGPGRADVQRYEQQLDLRASSMRTVTSGQLSQLRERVNRHVNGMKADLDLWKSLFSEPPPPVGEPATTPTTAVRPTPPSVHAQRKREADERRREEIRKLRAENHARMDQGHVVRSADMEAEISKRRQENHALMDQGHVVRRASPAPTRPTPPPPPLELSPTQVQLLMRLRSGQQSVVQKVWRLRREGHTIPEVLDYLNRNGIRPFTLNPNPLKPGQRSASETWSKSSVQRFVAAIGDTYQGPKNHGRAGPAGGAPGSRIPYGWQSRDGKLIAHPTEMWAISKMVEWYRLGFAAKTIAGMLDQENIPTRSGGKWQPTTVLQIIRRHLK